MHGYWYFKDTLPYKFSPGERLEILANSDTEEMTTTLSSMRNELTGSSCHGSGESRLPAEQSSQTLGQFPLQGHERSSFRDTIITSRGCLQVVTGRQSGFPSVWKQAAKRDDLKPSQAIPLIFHHTHTHTHTWKILPIPISWASQVAQVVKNPPAR